ncbi:hypothetical protein Zmor_026739 [Zophobas morio]|uniref:Uncharacterized protein n=1 Tax=Zophobas morio TaxID=2755281 RepID=A0AA38HW91_9CUCU|nr:hypothetical protein Zmor_026739 [Zophobas morio]
MGESFQRMLAIRICIAYRTLATEVLQVLAGTPLLDLIVHERIRIYEAVERGAAQEDTPEKLKERWCGTSGLENGKFLISNSVIVCICTSGLRNSTLFFEKLKNLLEFFSDKYNKTILVDDFNIDINDKPTKRKEHANILPQFGFNTAINEPTKVTTSSATCIDNIITNLRNAAIRPMSLNENSLIMGE